MKFSETDANRFTIPIIRQTTCQVLVRLRSRALIAFLEVKMRMSLTDATVRPNDPVFSEINNRDD